MPNQALLDYLDQRWNPDALLALAPARRTSPARPLPQSATKRRGVAVVGDSLGVGTIPYLKRYAKVKADVRVGRPSREGVRRYRQGTIVFDLGTNDASARDLRRSLHKLKRLNPNANIVVPLLHGPNAKQKNRVIRRSGVKVARVGSKGVGPDRIHLTASGYRRRARLLASSLD